MFRLYVQYVCIGYIYCTEAELLKVIWTKSYEFSTFYSQSPLLTDFTPPPLSKSGLKLVCSVNNVQGNLKSEIMPRNLNDIVTS